MKLIVKNLKPRNPFVAAALRRPAGMHRSGSQRQAQARELRAELKHRSESP
jgi:hypothetical protein